MTRPAVRRGWELHARLVRRSLERGYYQGWDLHPAQLPTRFAATYAFYREGFGAAADRLRNYVEQTGSSVMDEPATARALSDFVVRGVDCGAVSAAEVEAGTGLDAGNADGAGPAAPQHAESSSAWLRKSLTQVVDVDHSPA